MKCHFESMWKYNISFWIYVLNYLHFSHIISLGTIIKRWCIHIMHFNKDIAEIINIYEKTMLLLAQSKEHHITTTYSLQTTKIISNEIIPPINSSPNVIKESFLH